MVLIGVALIVRRSLRSAARSPSGIILGVLFIAAGAGRIYVERAL